MIRIHGLNKYFNKGRPGEIHVINNVTLDLPEKGMVAIFGKSGCGKTTLLNVIGGLDKFASGSLTVEGQSIRENTDTVRNKYIGYIFQNYNLNRQRSCFENVADALRLCGMEDEQEITVRVHAALANVAMEKFASRTPDTLSGGQQQRIAIARAIVKNPRIILADEPTGNLDEANTVMIMDLLKEIAKDHLVLLVTHEENLVDFYCDSVIELSDGKVLSTRENEAASGFAARDKNDIYLGELARNEITSENAEIEFYGEKPSTPIKLKLVNHGAKLYLQVVTPGVQVLDGTGEVKLHEGVYNENPQQNAISAGIDMSLLPPIEGKRFGHLFSLKSSIKSGYFSSVRSDKRKGRTLRRCMALFAAVIVFMSSIFGTAFDDIREVNNAYNHNIFYVYTQNAKASEKLNAAVKKDGTGIDFIRMMHHLPSGDEEIYFRTGTFETFEQYNFESGLKANAVYLDISLTKGKKLLAGKRENLANEEILISSKVADILLEKSTLGYITEYKDLCGLITTAYAVNGKNLRIAGVVASDESAIYMTEIALAKYTKDYHLYSTFYTLASDYGITVKDGEAVLAVWEDPSGTKLPALNESVKIHGMDLKVTKISKHVHAYSEYLADKGVQKMSDTDYFSAIVKAQSPEISEDSDAFKEAFAAAKDAHYYEYYDYYYSELDAYYRESCFFEYDNMDLWLYTEKGIRAAYFAHLPEEYYQASYYKERNGRYPTRTELSALQDGLPSILDDMERYYSIYENEFYENLIYPDSYSTTYLVSDKDFIALSKRIGDSHPTAVYPEEEDSNYDFLGFGDYSYLNVYYTVIHSSDPGKTEKWLSEEFSDLQAPSKYSKAIYTPDTMFDDLMRTNAIKVATNLITLAVIAVLMSICMYFIMRSSLMNRIREVGIYRAIGVSRKNLVFKFLVESAVLTTMTVFVGYLVTSGFLIACRGVSPLVSEIFYYPFWLALADLVLLFAISLFFGTLPVLSLLRKTPSEILSKYDI